MPENTSPEERLFKIIQQEKKTPPRSVDSSQKKSGGGWASGIKQSVVSWKDKLFSGKSVGGKNKTAGHPRKIYDIKLSTVNIVLSVLLAALVLFTAYYLVAKYPGTARVVSATATAQRALPSVDKEGERLQALDYYLQAAKERDIFSASQPVAAPAAATPAPRSESGSRGDLKLQGIALSDVPKVMINSEKDNKLYILKEGQIIGTTGIRVKEILHNKVILTSGDKDFEL